MLYKDICTKKEYQQNGETKAKWFKVGTLKKTDDGKIFIELNMYPNTPFYVFDQKEREDKPKPKPPEESVDLGEDTF